MLDIRTAEQSDVPRLQMLGQSAWRDTYGSSMSAAEIDEGLKRWWSIPQLGGEISSGVVLVAEDGGDVVGMVSAAELRPQAHVIWKLYVDRPQRSRGIGHELLHELDHMLGESTDEFWLEHYAFNTGAAAFYEREGFNFVREERTRLAGVDRTIVWRMKEREVDGAESGVGQNS